MAEKTRINKPISPIETATRALKVARDEVAKRLPAKQKYEQAVLAEQAALHAVNEAIAAVQQELSQTVTAN